MLDANVLLDCLILDASGVPRAGKAASDIVLNLCDQGGLQDWLRGTLFRSWRSIMGGKTLQKKRPP